MSDKKRKGINLAFWQKESGNMLSHGKGLSKEQVEELQKLREGDRLILFKNEKKADNTPEYTLQRYEKRQSNDVEDSL